MPQRCMAFEQPNTGSCAPPLPPPPRAAEACPEIKLLTDFIGCAAWVKLCLRGADPARALAQLRHHVAARFSQRPCLLEEAYQWALADLHRLYTPHAALMALVCEALGSSGGASSGGASSSGGSSRRLTVLEKGGGNRSGNSLAALLAGGAQVQSFANVDLMEPAARQLPGPAPPQLPPGAVQHIACDAADTSGCVAAASVDVCLEISSLMSAGSADSRAADTARILRPGGLALLAAVAPEDVPIATHVARRLLDRGFRLLRAADGVRLPGGGRGTATWTAFLLCAPGVRLQTAPLTCWHATEPTNLARAHPVLAPLPTRAAGGPCCSAPVATAAAPRPAPGACWGCRRHPRHFGMRLKRQPALPADAPLPTRAAGIPSSSTQAAAAAAPAPILDTSWAAAGGAAAAVLQQAEARLGAAGQLPLGPHPAGAELSEEVWLYFIATRPFQLPGPVDLHAPDMLQQLQRIECDAAAAGVRILYWGTTVHVQRRPQQHARGIDVALRAGGQHPRRLAYTRLAAAVPQCRAPAVMAQHMVPVGVARLAAAPQQDPVLNELAARAGAEFGLLGGPALLNVSRFPGPGQVSMYSLEATRRGGEGCCNQRGRVDCAETMGAQRRKGHACLGAASAGACPVAFRTPAPLVLTRHRPLPATRLAQACRR